MRSVDTLVIGAGQAGLAMSASLSDAGVDHAVLERGQVAERWRSERWDSLRLLTPNWATRLPNYTYDGPEPQGFMTAAELVDRFERYAQGFDAPVHEHTSVESVTQTDEGFAVQTSDGAWKADRVVIATGWTDRARVPSAASELPSSILAAHARRRYRNPEQVPDGGVLVVGASASGAQIADELAAAGSRRHPRGGPPHPASPPVSGRRHLVVARAERPLGGHDRHRPRPEAGPQRRVAAADRHSGAAEHRHDDAQRPRRSAHRQVLRLRWRVRAVLA